MTPTPETPAPLSFNSPAIKDALQHYNLLKPLLRASLSNAQVYGLDLADALTHEHEARVKAEAKCEAAIEQHADTLKRVTYWYDRAEQAEAERDSLRKALEVAQPYVVWCDPEGRDAGDYPAAKAIVERDAKLVTAALSGLPAQAGGRKCEGCAEPATHRDNEGIPLCKACYDSLLDEP